MLVACALVVAACGGGGGSTAKYDPTINATPARLGYADRAGFASANLLIYESAADRAHDLQLMKATGAKWIRFDVAWSVIEEQRGAPDWSRIDAVVADASAMGFRLLGILAYTPAWARPAGSGDSDHTAPSPEARPDFARFAGDAAARYAGRVEAWEVWNEPNTDAFWKPKPDAAGFADLVRQASAAIRTSAPGATVLLGGLAQVGGKGDEEIPQAKFLGEVLDAGAGAAIDGVSLHASSYPNAPDDPKTASDNALLQLDDLHKVLAGRQLASVGLWVTEYGAPTGGSGAVDEATQARLIVAAYRTALARDDVRVLLVYTFRDFGDTDAVDDHYGLVRRDFTPKPAYDEFTTLMQPPVIATSSTSS